MPVDIRQFTGSDFQYDYSELPSRASEEQIQAYCQAVRQRFAPIARSFTDDDNSLWVLRHFLALKFAIASAILSGSAYYARDHNLMMAVPYFNYYALLSASRAFLLTAPDVAWERNKTMEMTHQKIINVTADLMTRLNRDLATKAKDELERARDHRELFSYRFPGGGLSIVAGNNEPEQVADLVRLIAELAMLNSECFEASLAKLGPATSEIPILKDHDWAQAYEIVGTRVVDGSDREKFQKFVRKWGQVSTLDVMAYDGLVEDFYGAWVSGEDDESLFNPDDWMHHILCL